MRQEILLQAGNEELYFNESQFAFSSEDGVVTGSITESIFKFRI